MVESGDGGLALTVRGDGVPSKTFAGPANTLPKLTSDAAEYVYSQSEPALYAAYLSNAGRDAEAVAFCRAAFASASPANRPYLLNSWAIGLQNTGGSYQEALELFSAAVKLKPDFWVGYTATCRNSRAGSWATRRERGAQEKRCAARPAGVRGVPGTSST